MKLKGIENKEKMNLNIVPINWNSMFINVLMNEHLKLYCLFSIVRSKIKLTKYAKIKKTTATQEYKKPIDI